MSSEVWPHIKKELIDLFPHGLHLELLFLDASEIEKALKAIELNTSRIMLGAQRQQLQRFDRKIKSM